MEREQPSGESPIPAGDLLGPGLIHEMRHPLMGIKAGLTLLARKLGPQVAGLGEWEMLSSQVQRLEELFRGYQELFTPGRAAPSRFAVEPVVQRSVDLLSYRLSRLGPRFSYERERVPHYGYGAPAAVLHAVTNLLANAADAVDEGSGDARVSVRVVKAAKPGGQLEVRVSDEGAGIPAEQRALLFEPRFTTKAPGRGTGLGLHIARTLMRRFGGQVRLVADDDPARLAWARTEFAVEIAPPPEVG